MAKRKELKNIASGLYGSFISRNNDVRGYWGVGKLCLAAQRHHTKVVHLDLLSQSNSLTSTEFDKLVVGYNDKLQKHLESRHLPSKLEDAFKSKVGCAMRTEPLIRCAQQTLRLAFNHHTFNKKILPSECT